MSFRQLKAYKKFITDSSEMKMESCSLTKVCSLCPYGYEHEQCISIFLRGIGHTKETIFPRGTYVIQ